MPIEQASSIWAPQAEAYPWGSHPQLLPNQQSTPAVSVMGGLPPVPGYLVAMIKRNEYVDFTMLRLRNLSKLPSIPPTCTQLERLLRDELEPIRAFTDWAEAWAVYASVVGRSDPSKFLSLVTYFLTIAKAQLDVPGSGWRDYDIAFRKQVADNPSLSWSPMDPTLYLSTVLTSGAQYNPNGVRKNVVSQPQRNTMS